ncbi:DNA repair protein RecN [Actinomyces sp. 594]|uniref:DNA repair protein RecN n=1 Tax=Actinomyces sp. 594 TaxID=2057793 RepID=UPI001C580A27|nr:DNA repair protein RecN [Actinomyces sp. 594]MBW3069606.1 DNA repair protein RecN [Actinomyces sp. 594]
MIESLHIENLGVIETADLQLSPGLTALTGETGAGKTMVLTSLGLLLGQRAEATVVRAGADRALVEGAFVLSPYSRAASRAADAGAEIDDDLLLASRTVPASGRSRAHLGGRAVPSTVLADVGARLVSVHGQADQLRLRSASAGRAALDGLGGPRHAALCRRYAEAYQARNAAAAALEQWHAGAQARRAEAEDLRRWLEQLEKLAPQPGEDTALTAEAERLDHAEDLRRAAAITRTALAGDEDTASPEVADVTALIAAAERALARVADVDPALTQIGQRLHRLGIVSADLAGELSAYLASLDADPARLAWVQERRAELARACREIGGPSAALDDVDSMLAWGEAAAARLEELEGSHSAATELTEDLAGAQAVLEDLATELSAARHGLAERLQQAVNAELAGLEMKDARLVVDLEPLEELGPTGAETVSLLLVSHPGAPALPLGKGASGGELSRIMLALEVVLAEAALDEAEHDDPARDSAHHRRTFIFDEIDAGVGGRAAREIGRRLARLARSHQVVVVTHLAQVAAWADTQLVVRKERGPDAAGDAPAPQHAGDNLPTVRTRVLAVTGDARVRELARMLSGHDDSESALRHAAELIDEARMAQSQS